MTTWIHKYREGVCFVAKRAHWFPIFAYPAFRSSSFLFCGVIIQYLLISGNAPLQAAPYTISSGSGSFNPPATIEGVLVTGSSGDRNSSRYSTTLTGFRWDGSAVVTSGGLVHGLVNQTGYKVSFPNIKLTNSMIFDAGSGGFAITNWGSNLQGNDITFRANDAQVSITGSLVSSSGAGNVTIESGVRDFTMGGPLETNGGNVYFYGTGDAAFNGASLNGGDFIWDSTANGTFGYSSLNSQGGNMSFDGNGDFTFNGQIGTGGGDFDWNITGDALFKNNINAGAGAIDFSGDGTLTFNNPVSTTSLTGTISIGGDQNVIFSNTISTSGGSITLSGNATIDAQNTINTGGGNFVVEGNANLTTHNTVDTGSGDINISTAGNVDIMANVNTNGGNINVTGSGTTTFEAYVNTGNGNIVLSDNGTLAFNNDPSLGTGQIIISGSGTLLLDADGTGSNSTSTRVNVTLEGGTFRTAGQNRFVGSLTLNAESRIDMGSGTSTIDINTLALENNFNPYDGVSLITIENWTSGNDSIRFNSNVTGNKDYFQFEGDFGSGYGTYDANITHLGGGVYELTPGSLVVTPVVPEPKSLILLLISLGGISYWHFQRKRQNKFRSKGMGPSLTQSTKNAGP